MIEDFGDNWPKLDILSCYETPDKIDMTDLFSDKAHSMQRSDVLNHIKNHPDKPISVVSVMETSMSTPIPNTYEFLKKKNDEGFD